MEMDTRSPLEGIFGILSGLPQGHDKPVKHALYNAVALLLLFLCCAATWALFMILEPFVKPLIWALLVGSVLHPLKRSLRDRFQGWFENLETSNTPIVLGVILLPINIINDLSDLIGDLLVKYFKIIVAVAVAIPTALLVYNYSPGVVNYILYSLYIWFFAVVNNILSNSTPFFVLIILVGYISMIFLLWKPENNTKFHYGSVGIWLLLSGCFASQFGSFQMPIFILIQVIFFGGFIAEVYNIYKDLNEEGHSITFIESLYLSFHEKVIDVEIVEDTEDKKVAVNTNETKPGIEEKSSQESSSATDVEIIEGTEELKAAVVTNEIKDGIEEKENQEKLSSGEVEPEIKPKSGVKFSDENINKEKKSALNLQKKDPWSLELFDEASPEIIKRADSELSNAVLITNQGIHVIPPASNVLQKILKPAPPKKELKRSLSQPQFYMNSRVKERARNLFNYHRKMSFTNATQPIIDTEKFESTFYLYLVLWGCIIVLLWKNIFVVPLLLLPILFYCIKRIGTYFGLWTCLSEKFNVIFAIVSNWFDERHDALVPVPVRGFYRILYKCNVYLKTSIKESIDTVSSFVVIFALIIFSSCASIFIAFQIYTEGIMMVQMISNLINQTVVHNPELRQLLPPNWDDTVDSILDNAYQYGREGISKAIKSMMTDVDSAKSEKLEKQILELWDRLYQSWMSNVTDNGPHVTPEAVQMTWTNFLSDIQKSPEMFNLSGIMDFAKQNIGMLMSLLESIWAIVISNVGLVLGSFSAFLSVILGGGTAVLNFILNMIVFLTTLFYLLSSSGDLYKPVELLTNFSSSGRRFGHALEGAINGVFTASFKMALFYGLWTWFIHNLFGAQIVYLPSAFATILGAVPFLGTYWACLPAVLDLWLAQGRSIAAILFAIFQFLPTSVVDTTIYKEIKGGGHPYLTGLAIAGGIFCLGVEGAIIGPLLLCGLYVAIDLSSNLFKESPSEESLNLRLQLQER